MGTENLILLLIEAGFYFVFMVGILHLRHQIGIGVQSFVGHDLDDIRRAVVELAA